MNYYEACAGIGGMALGFRQAGLRISGLCERDEWCQGKLRQIFPESEIHGDVYGITGQFIREQCGKVDVFAAGFPCQPYSIAGHRKAANDKRDLWTEILRLVGEVQPRWFVGENSFNFELLGWERCQADLAGAGYESLCFDLPAAAFGLPTVERHLWIIAAPTGERPERLSKAPFQNVGNATGKFSRIDTGSRERRDISKSVFCRVGERVSRRSDKDSLRALGNAVPPPMARFIASAIMQQEAA